MNRYLSVISILGIITTITLKPSPTLAFEPAEIYAKVQQFTVQIDGEETGTGTIIERNNDTYTVLTCWHVMDTPGNYQVTTADGNTHQVTTVENLPDIDLAVITFSTSNTYPIADLGDSTKATSGLDAYVVGYPDPFPGVPERQYFTDSTEIQSRLKTGEKGYQIIHDGSFTPGSSGGGIFDREARLIGINGQFISEGNTGKAYGTGIPLEIYLAARNSFTTPESWTPPQDFVSEGKRKLKQQDYQGAIAEFDQALASNPKDLNALSGRAEAYYWQDNFEAAIQDFNTVLQLNPDNATFLFYRGTAHGQLGEYQKAIADYNQAILLDPDDAPTYNNRGNSYGNLGEEQKAIADYNQAIRLDPDYAFAYNNRGVSYRNLGEYEKAIADYNQAIYLDPDYAFAYNNRGVSYRNLGEYEKAIADYNQAIRLDPDYAKAYYNRGLSNKILENNSQAITDFQQAADLYQQQGDTVRYKKALNQISELR